MAAAGGGCEGTPGCTTVAAPAGACAALPGSVRELFNGEPVLDAAAALEALGAAAVCLAAFLPPPLLFLAIDLDVGSREAAEGGVALDRRGGMRKSEGEGRTRFVARVGPGFETPDPAVIGSGRVLARAGAVMGVTGVCRSPLNAAVAGSGRNRSVEPRAAASICTVVLDESGMPYGAVDRAGAGTYADKSIHGDPTSEGATGGSKRAAAGTAGAAGGTPGVAGRTPGATAGISPVGIDWSGTMYGTG